MRLTADEAMRRAMTADHGILGTLRAGQGPDLVPVCFAIDATRLAIPVDRVKPKASADLQRIRNLMADPHATLLVESWDAADWSRLWWVRLRLEPAPVTPAEAARLAALLSERYPQYRTAPFERLLTFRIVEVTGWVAADAGKPAADAG
jgi:PPOX class probable F420-dependent enzyme